MFDILTFEAILREERARISAETVRRMEQDIAHGLAPELAVASHVTDDATRRRLQQKLAVIAHRRPHGPKERLQAYPHDPFV